jgi:hypothetical protein
MLKKKQNKNKNYFKSKIQEKKLIQNTSNIKKYIFDIENETS